MSIAGGCHRAVERAAAFGCDCVQLFTGNPRSFSLRVQSGKSLAKDNDRRRAKAISAEEGRRFRAALAELGVARPLAHNSYLINLASPDDALWRMSIDAMVQELLRAETLGIPWVVAHPGTHTTGSEAGGIDRIVAAIDEIDRQAQGLAVGCLLETTAGQGTSIGWRFEQLAAILNRARNPSRLGVCFDTCHVFAAGYPFRSRRGYRTTMREFDAVVGLSHIHAFHLNDSLREQGSRVDRHTHIGCGRIGLRRLSLPRARPSFSRRADVSGNSQGQRGRGGLGRGQPADAPRTGREESRVGQAPPAGPILAAEFARSARRTTTHASRSPAGMSRIKPTPRNADARRSHGNTERPSSARATLEHDCAGLRWALMRLDVAVDEEVAVVGHGQKRHPAVSGGRLRRGVAGGIELQAEANRVALLDRGQSGEWPPRKPSNSAACLAVRVQGQPVGDRHDERGRTSTNRGCRC